MTFVTCPNVLGYLLTLPQIGLHKPFELVHFDVWVFVLESFDGYRYFVTFVDDFTRVTWLYLLKFKSEM